VQNKSQENKECDTRICFIEVRFSQTYSPLRWSQRPGLFQPFPSLKRSLGPSELLFSIKREQTSLQGPPHNWCLLPWLQLSCSQERMKEGSNPSARAQKNTTKSLSLITKALCGIGRGFDHFGVSCIECLALVSSWKVENLDDLNVGWLGVFIAPTTKLAVWWRLLSHGAPDTVRCASHVTRPLGSDRWSSVLWARLAVRWRTGQVL
jgi:hypothetical protein